MKLIRNYFLSALFLFCSSLGAQSLTDSRSNGAFTYILGLNNDQAKAYIEEPYTFPLYAVLNTCLLDSFFSDSSYSKKLKPGNYLFVHAVQNTLICELKLIHPFYVELAPRSSEIAIQVLDEAGNDITDAKVLLGSRRISYNKEKKWYSIPGNRKETRLWVESNGCLEYRDLVSSRDEDRFSPYMYFPVRLYKHIRYWFISKFMDREGRPTKPVYGYIDFNKPKYLPHDTVKLKVYLQDKHGRAFKKEGLIEVFEGDYSVPSRKVLQAKIKPVTPGAYVFQFVMGDSLKIDRSYLVSISDARTTTLWKEETFRYEDYQLDETSYSVNLDKKEYLCNDSVVFHLAGKDANGLPLMDGRYHLVVTRDQVLSYYSDSLYVSDTLWVKDGFLENAALTNLRLPDSLLQPLRAMYKAEVMFNNSNNESHTEKIEFTVDRKQEVLMLSMKDSMLACSASGNVHTNDKHYLLCRHTRYGQNDTLSYQQVLLPFDLPVNPMVARYELSCRHNSATLVAGEESAGLTEAFVRTSDSVFLKINNPRGLRIHYMIYRSSKLLFQGIGTSLNWKQGDKTPASYYAQYNYIWAGEEVSRRGAAYCFTKNLHLNIRQPALVSPGERAEVTIQVTDYLGRPAKHVNLTAGCISSQFKEKAFPEIPYRGRVKGGIPYHRSFRMEDLGTPINTLVLTPEFRKRFKLDTIAWYQAVYPAKGLYLRYDRAALSNAQFTPHVFAGGVPLKIFTVHLDKDLVYYSGASLHPEFSIPADSGYHRIQLRLRDRSLQIDSVLLKPGYKLELTIDTLVACSRIKKRNEMTKLSSNEKYEIAQTLFGLSRLRGKGTAYVWQGDRIWSFSNQEGSYNDYNILIGPFKPGYDIHVAVQGDYITSFPFESGYNYEVQSTIVKMRELKKDLVSQYLFPAYNGDQQISFGSRVLEQKDILLNAPPPVYSPFISSQSKPYHTEAGNGTFACKYTGDSSLYAVVMQQVPADTLNTWVFHDSKNTFFNLSPGTYDFTFVSFSGYYMTERVVIRANTTYYKCIRENPKRKLDAGNRISKILFEQPSDTNINKSYSFGSGGLQVMVLEAKGEGMPGVIVRLLDYSGQVMGAVTNIDGRILFSNLADGTYEIIVSYVGCLTKRMRGLRVKKGKVTPVEVKMEAGTALKSVAIIEDNELVIRGNREIKALGYSVSTIDGVRESAMVIESLAAKAPGVQVTGMGYVSRLDYAGANLGEEFTISKGMRKDKSRADSSSGLEAIQALDRNAKSLRTSFADYAYWQPNMLSDEKGEAHFNVLFPDNITLWKAHAEGMDAQKRSGLGFAETKSFRKVNASLSLPRFLIAGDSSILQEKIFNYTRQSYPLKTNFSINGKSVHQRDTLLRDKLLSSDLFIAPDADSVRLNFTASLENGYSDGESRLLPVYPAGIDEKAGVFLNLGKDTALDLNFDPTKGLVHMYMSADPLDILLQDIEWMKHYPYNCNEQQASRLISMLAEKGICSARRLKFTSEKAIKKLISSLQASQNPDGSWGWWNEGAANAWMTAYVLNALSKAKAAGYAVEPPMNGFAYLRWYLGGHIYDRNTQLFALLTMSELKQNMEYEQILKTIPRDSLQLEARIQFEAVCKNAGLAFNLPHLLAQKKQTVMGNIFWQGQGEGWYDNSLACSLAMYEFLSKDSLHAELRDKLFNYFLEARKTGGRWRNTVEISRMIDVLAPELIRRQGTDAGKPAIALSAIAYNKNIDHFPFSDTLHASRLHVSLKGSGPVYFTAWQKSFNTHPVKEERLFKIRTYFIDQGKDTIQILSAGKTIWMEAEVEVKQKAEYLMLTIPIPAGCSYAEQNRRSCFEEVHRELYKDRVAVFCAGLNPGRYHFRVALEARYAGSYTLNPARIESMYFPTIMGRNAMKRIRMETAK
jgi:hypothetical protein